MRSSLGTRTRHLVSDCNSGRRRRARIAGAAISTTVSANVSAWLAAATSASSCNSPRSNRSASSIIHAQRDTPVSRRPATISVAGLDSSFAARSQSVSSGDAPRHSNLIRLITDDSSGVAASSSARAGRRSVSTWAQSDLPLPGSASTRTMPPRSATTASTASRVHLSAACSKQKRGLVVSSKGGHCNPKWSRYIAESSTICIPRLSNR
jgi:hypothetical protein